jgi:hypothetical protein
MLVQHLHPSWSVFNLHLILITMLIDVDTFNYVEEHHPELVAVGSKGVKTGNTIDFCEHARFLYHLPNY